MNAPRHRRFTRTEVILHGLHAVFYLTLWFTGLFLILQRTLDESWISIPNLAMIHRKFGIVLAVLAPKFLILSLLIPVIRVFWKSIGQALCWTTKDIVWLFKMPLHVLFPKVKLPPSGRYNPGQKLNILIVLITVSGLCISGVWMVRVPGALMPWIIHVGCFLVGSIMFGIHLYLSLINPPTLPAFRAMLDGTVSLEHARMHHPLSLPSPVEPIHDPHIYRLPLFATVILIVVALMSGVWLYGADRFAEKARTWVASEGLISLQPGPLIPGHAGEKEAGYCTACHDDLKRPESESCLDCHAAIAERMSQQTGYHGKLTAPCIDCHTDHKGADADIRPLDRKAFNHLQADFVLDGAHARLDCPACHYDKSPTVPGVPKRFQFIGIAYSSCTGCHTDPHQDSRSADCLRCHTTQSWRRPELTFDHDRDSRFALQGKHARVACDKCHPETPTKSPRIRLYDLGTACKDCHKDRHNGQFQSSCEHCHNEKGWKDLKPDQFHGAKSKFPLRGEHAQVACNKCHTPKERQKLASAQFVGLDTQCQSCHKDPHAGQMSHGCTACHTEQDWEGPALRFAHNVHSAFHLDAVHATVSCQKCHPSSPRPVRYRPIEHECQSCHAVQQQALEGKSDILGITVSPDPHFGCVACTECHDNSRPRQSPPSYTARCVACHNPDYANLYYQWSGILDRLQSDAGQNNDKAVGQIHEIGFHNLGLIQDLQPDKTDSSLSPIR